jgi:small subunit ribosomal protein S16
MLMIRLARFGAKKKPFYRIVVIEKERARNGRNLEVVGHYNPLTDPAKVDLKRERITYWTKNGAQLSDTVARLIKNNPEPVAAAAWQASRPVHPVWVVGQFACGAANLGRSRLLGGQSRLKAVPQRGPQGRICQPHKTPN